MKAHLIKNQKHYEEKKKKLKSEIEENISELKYEFGEINSIAKFITAYLLHVTERPDPFSISLVSKLFGKTAQRNYSTKGPRNILPKTQAWLKNQFMSMILKPHSNLENSEIKNLFSEGSHVKRSSKKLFLDPYQVDDKTCTNHKEIQKKNQFKFGNLQKFKQKKYKEFKYQNYATSNNSDSSVFDYYFNKKDYLTIEPKYISHWKWLYKNKNFTGDLFKSFDSLLRRVYKNEQNIC
jgi:hypothetical protein